ncbi:hypothetical protein E3A20_28970 [Planctomyces bekefii]|uniref:NAD(P)-binding domain-containing protein n=1 Tax=Planctomyces bekefii TaxID=1653850 RepID=A0A5C6LZN7_9PLAN|nr:hypothetical protein E3A20_28970 [Planctomyces bekefii]
MQTKVALVAGPTGLVGRELVLALLKSNQHKQVIALSRRPLGPEFSSFGDRLLVRSLPTGNEALHADEFYCALGTTLKRAGSQQAFRSVDYDLVLDLAKRCQAGGTRRMILVSALGASPESALFYSRVKGETERDIKKLNFPELAIYQPSFL